MSTEGMEAIAALLSEVVMLGLERDALAVCEAYPGYERNEWRAISRSESKRRIAEILREAMTAMERAGKTGAQTVPQADPKGGSIR